MAMTSYKSKVIPVIPDCEQCKVLKNEVRKLIFAFKTFANLDPELQNPDILIRNLERLVGNHEEIKMEQENETIPTDTVETTVGTEAESTCEIYGEVADDGGGGCEDDGGEYISIYEVVSPHHQPSVTTGYHMNEHEEVHDSGNHSEVSRFNTEEVEERTNKRQQVETEQEESGETSTNESQKQLAPALPPPPVANIQKRKRFKSNAWTGQNRKPLIATETPPEFVVVDKNIKSKKRKNPLKLKLRSKKSLNSAGGSKTTTSSAEVDAEFKAGKNVKAALFSSDDHDNSKSFDSALCSTLTSQPGPSRIRYRASEFWSPESERESSSVSSTHNSMTDNKSNSELQQSFDSITAEKSTIVSEGEAKDCISPVITINKKIMDMHVDNGDEEEVSAESGIGSLSENRNINIGLLDNCAMDKDFWTSLSADSINGQTIKYKIRLHDIRRQFFTSSSEETAKFVIQEMRESSELSTSILTVKEMTEKIRRTPAWLHKQVWLDVRDFDLFSNEQITKEFFSLVSKSVNYFSLGKRYSSYSELLDVQLLGYIYEDLAPHLEYLSVDDDVLTSWEDFFVPFSVQWFPRLRTLRLHNTQHAFTYQFIDQILKTSPYLEIIHGFPLRYIKLLTKYRRSRMQSSQNSRQLLKSLCLEFSPYYDHLEEYQDDLNQLMKLQSCGLEEFQIPLYYVCETIPTAPAYINRRGEKRYPLDRYNYSEIIRQNQATLKKLTLKSHRKIRSSDWPVLEKLETLEFHLYFKNSKTFPFFTIGVGFQVAIKFPNLTNVEINFKDWDPTTLRKSRQQTTTQLNKFFPADMFVPGVVFQSVVSLKLVNYIPVDCMAKLKTLFQNIKILTLRTAPSRLTQILPKVFALWRDLEQLTVEITHENSGEPFQLDSALTGLSPFDCNILRALTERDRDVDQLRTNPSIVNMKGLRLFKISYQMPSPDDENVVIPLLSEVAVHYGIGKRLMPQLKVFIAFDDSCTLTFKNELLSTLEKIKSSVTIDGEM